MNKFRKLVFPVVVFFTASLGFAQETVDLDEAIRTAANEISEKLPAGSKIGIVNFSSESQDMSDWLVDNMAAVIKGTEKFTLVERNAKNLALINSETDFQYSGEASDDSVIDLGEKLGAQYLVHGSFEQFGGMLQLTVRTVNVETAEISVLIPFSITPSALTTRLLGDEKVLSTAQDYLDMIARYQVKLSSIQKDRNKEIQILNAQVMSKYQKQLNEINAQEQEPWESRDEYNNRIATESGMITKKRDTELSGLEKNIAIRYDNLYNNVEILMDKVVRDLQSANFVLDGDSVQVMIGMFDREAKPKKYWPVSIKSQNEIVNFNWNGKHEVNDADVKSEYQKVEAWKAAGTLEGEIKYQLVQSANKKVFEVKVLNVRVYDTVSGSTMLNEPLDFTAGNISAAKKVDTKSALSSSSKGKSKKKTQTENGYSVKTDAAFSSDFQSQDSESRGTAFGGTEKPKFKGIYTEFQDLSAFCGLDACWSFEKSNRAANWDTSYIPGGFSTELFIGNSWFRCFTSYTFRSESYSYTEKFKYHDLLFGVKMGYRWKRFGLAGGFALGSSMLNIVNESPAYTSSNYESWTKAMSIAVPHEMTLFCGQNFAFATKWTYGLRFVDSHSSGFMDVDLGVRLHFVSQKKRTY